MYEEVTAPSDVEGVLTLSYNKVGFHICEPGEIERTFYPVIESHKELVKAREGLGHMYCLDDPDKAEFYGDFSSTRSKNLKLYFYLCIDHEE